MITHSPYSLAFAAYSMANQKSGDIYLCPWIPAKCKRSTRRRNNCPSPLSNNSWFTHPKRGRRCSAPSAVNRNPAFSCVKQTKNGITNCIFATIFDIPTQIFSRTTGMRLSFCGNKLLHTRPTAELPEEPEEGSIFILGQILALRVIKQR